MDLLKITIWISSKLSNKKATQGFAFLPTSLPELVAILINTLKIVTKQYSGLIRLLCVNVTIQISEFSEVSF